MGGGKSQKGGKHGTIGRTLAHDILYRQQSHLNTTLKYKENSVYERNDLDEYIIGKLNNLENYLTNRSLREVKSTTLTSQLFNCIQNSINNVTEEYPEIPVPRRIYHFTTQEKVLITKLNKERELKNKSRKYFKRKNKKIVDQFMHGHMVKSFTPKRNNTINNTNNTNNSVNSSMGSSPEVIEGDLTGVSNTTGDILDEEEDSALGDDSTDDSVDNSSVDTVEDTVETPTRNTIVNSIVNRGEGATTISAAKDTNNSTINSSGEGATTISAAPKVRANDTIKGTIENSGEGANEEMDSDGGDGAASPGDKVSDTSVCAVASTVTENPVTQYLNYIISESKRIRIEKLTVEEWDQIEMRNFYKWRSILSEVELREKSTMTPYEKNLEFWRQLWRVIERSHLILIILDARDPLFFRVKDLENYIKQINQHKQFILVLNKADFLTEDLRTKWAQYFKSQGVDYLFFSTIYNSNSTFNVNSTDSTKSYNTVGEIDSRIYNVELLLEKIKYYKNINGSVSDKYVVGFVGYPNVGKSSLINCLMESTRTCVGIQPGKTKHIQTLPLKNSDIILCDCPGLIFPNLVSTKYHLLINSIISTAHFKGDMTIAVQLICNLIPQQVCKRYDIDINQCLITINSNTINTTNNSNNSVGNSVRVLYSVKVLEELCKNRNYISAGKGGQLDYTRASKLIINDFTQGLLLYCKLPPQSNTTLNNNNMTNSMVNSVDNSIDKEIDSVDDGVEETGLVEELEMMKIGKTLVESKQDEDNVNKWLKQQLHKDEKVKMTKRKMRFLIKGKRKNPS